MTVAGEGLMDADVARFREVSRTGDANGFAQLTERHRRELHVHCYRMLASYEDAQDLTQETFLRAWRRRETFEGRASLRAWLYRIATNACLDFLARRPDRVPVPSTSPGAGAEVRYLQPYPDRLLDELPADEDDPGEALVAKETIELAFLVAVQHLPPRQRAVLILRDVLGWSAKETAAVLDGTVASVNSALQRARATLREHLPHRRTEWASSRGELSEEQQAVVRRYLDASARNDVDGLTALLCEDLRFAMPPEPGSWVGRDRIVADWVSGGFGSPAFGTWRCVLTWANRQPAVVSYLRRPDDTRFRAFAMDVLRLVDGEVAEIVAFPVAVCAAFDLPEVLEVDPLEEDPAAGA